MSPIRPTSIIILLIFILPGKQAPSINSDELCSSRTLNTIGGKILVESTRMFKVECEPGYVAPLSSPNQSYIYRCKDGEMNRKMPKGCVEKRIPYRKVGFHVLLVETKKTLELCGDAQKQAELVSRYNETVEKSDSVFQENKLYIANCSPSKYPNDYTRILAVVTNVLKRNVSSDTMPGGHAHTILTAFNLLVECMALLGYLTTSEAKNATLVYTANSSIVGYHCDDHLQMRFDAGTDVCVGCGKGFWMDTNKQCHPCGPGFYNILETAVECLPCPVQYMYGLWSAVSLAECFVTRRDQLTSMSRLQERILVPVAFLIVIIVGVTLIHKRRPSDSDAKTNRGVRSFSTWQVQPLEEAIPPVNTVALSNSLSNTQKVGQQD